MNSFREFLDAIETPDKRERMESILTFLKKEFPGLKEEIKWNQPMLTDHGTFIMPSAFKPLIAVAPEAATIERFKADLKGGIFSHGGAVQIKWTDKVDFDLLEKNRRIT